MRNSNIAFDNLRTEMSRKNIGIVEMARDLGYNRDTLARKLSGRASISLSDAFNIQKTFFPKMNLSYLFSELDSVEQADYEAECKKPPKGTEGEGGEGIAPHENH